MISVAPGSPFSPGGPWGGDSRALIIIITSHLITAPPWAPPGGAAGAPQPLLRLFRTFPPTHPQSDTSGISFVSRVSLRREAEWRKNSDGEAGEGNKEEAMRWQETGLTFDPLGPGVPASPSDP